MTIERMEHVGIVVDDLAGAIAFPAELGRRPGCTGEPPGPPPSRFAVDDVDATLAGLQAHGAKLVGAVESYRDAYRLCYVRGPAGIIVELVEKIG